MVESGFPTPFQHFDLQSCWLVQLLWIFISLTIFAGWKCITSVAILSIKFANRFVYGWYYGCLLFDSSWWQNSTTDTEPDFFDNSLSVFGRLAAPGSFWSCWGALVRCLDPTDFLPVLLSSAVRFRFLRWCLILLARHWWGHKASVGYL